MEIQKVKYTSTPLKEWGDKLPIGFPIGGEPSREIAARNFTMKQERQLGELRDKDRQQNVAKFVSLVLTHLCTKLGPHDLEAMKEPERRVIIGQMWMPDVYFAYVWLRIQALGTELVSQINCPFCQREFEWVADLETIEVRVPDKIDELYWDYVLKYPFEFRGKRIERLTVGPCLWSALEPVRTGEFNTGEAKAAIIRGSIKMIEGIEHLGPLAPDELDEMSKFDLERITFGLEDNRLGPDMSLEGNCPKCNREFNTALDWGYDSFFSTSSRSPTPAR